MDKEILYNDVHTIVCSGRMFHECYLRKYRVDSELESCEEVPPEIQLKYAQSLLIKGDKHLHEAIRFYSRNGMCLEAIKLIKSGGVQYDS